MNARVSVVVPAYNNGATISDTISSILNQSYRDFELIVADHGSSDDTWARLQEFADRPEVKLFTTEPGGGAVRNWNRVTDLASGEYIKLVCGDDLIYPDCIAEQVAALDRSPDAVLAASTRDVVDDRGRMLVRDRGLGGLSGVVPGDLAIRRSLRLGTNIFGEPACVLARREALVAAGGWDSRFPYLIDVATYGRILQTGALVAVPGPQACFRVSLDQWSVELAGDQATQAADYHRWLHEARPEVITSADVRVGNARARLLAMQRRALYLYLSLARRRSSRPS